ncbi:hypothetical protein DACRYDRAFT_23957 [Dacryopinax primogenitus]|uniref:Uncharacterized protein n=1 Tax=Dacryopinax primogenitus (strain DJM 731) TaxID=1858805 RepID=M5FQY5_DACPD|nr:uncharacterized protein DACRYDRAFT_23957 [Dacryopinax primogenitus]EJT99430.1 hypothetical protein DACRYDRAFT_23957 [Dacryopinax primogenitus]
MCSVASANAGQADVASLRLLYRRTTRGRTIWLWMLRLLGVIQMIIGENMPRMIAGNPWEGPLSGRGSAGHLSRSCHLLDVEQHQQTGSDPSDTLGPE